MVMNGFLVVRHQCFYLFRDYRLLEVRASKAFYRFKRFKPEYSCEFHIVTSFAA